MLTVYVPTGSPGAIKLPSPLDCSTVSVFVPSLCTVTLALATMAPVASVTVPAMVAVVDNCACSMGQKAHETANTMRAARERRKEVGVRRRSIDSSIAISMDKHFLAFQNSTRRKLTMSTKFAQMAGPHPLQISIRPTAD